MFYRNCYSYALVSDQHSELASVCVWVLESVSGRKKLYLNTSGQDNSVSTAPQRFELNCILTHISLNVPSQ